MLSGGLAQCANKPHIPFLPLWDPSAQFDFMQILPLKYTPILDCGTYRLALRSPDSRGSPPRPSVAVGPSRFGAEGPTSLGQSLCGLRSGVGFTTIVFVSV
jgi:hypothetical protein